MAGRVDINRGDIWTYEFQRPDKGTSVHPQRRIVLLDGMVKKRDDIPAAVLKRLRQLQREVK